MKKTKILFFHFDMGGGGAEKVLVNLVNNLDKGKYDITVQTIFGQGPNRKLLDGDIRFKCLLDRPAFRGIRQIFKLLPPELLHRLLVRETYDVEIAFLEQIPTRIVGGCSDNSTRLYCWIHNTARGLDSFSTAFRDMNEFKRIYSRFTKIAFVSQGAMDTFYPMYDVRNPGAVVHNVLDTDSIISNGQHAINLNLDSDSLNLCSVGRLCGQKRYDRLIRSLYTADQNSSRKWHLYLIGAGSEHDDLANLAMELGINDKITFLGFQSNPHQFVSKMDLFVCSSESEGYSTAVTESLILGIPILTTDCSGMDELIGDTRAGIIVENNEEALTNGLLRIFNESGLLETLKKSACERSKFFSKEKSIREFENFINPAK